MLEVLVVFAADGDSLAAFEDYAVGAGYRLNPPEVYGIGLVTAAEAVLRQHLEKLCESKSRDDVAVARVNREGVVHDL